MHFVGPDLVDSVFVRGMLEKPPVLVIGLP
jgi:hypothetical protein